MKAMKGLHRDRSTGGCAHSLHKPRTRRSRKLRNPTKRLAPPAGVDSEWTESSLAGRSQRRTTEAAGRSQPATNGLGNHCSSPNRATSAISSDHDSTYDHSVSVVTPDAISLNVHKPGGDVLALARELAAAAECGDLAEVVRLAGLIAACGEPDAMVG